MTKEDNTSKSVDKLRVYFKKHKAESYPITEHPLEQADEYLKGIYITMLCTIMCNDSEPREEQRLFIERLMKGIGISGNINDYIKKALEINDKFAEEFLRQFKDNKLKYNFVVDALVLLLNIGSPEKKDVEFISEICDMFALSKEDIQFYSNMAIGIVEQDSEKFIYASNENLKVDVVERFKYYYKEFFDGALIYNENLYCYTCEKVEMVFEDFDIDCNVVKFTNKTVIFENYTINMNDVRLEFEDCDEIKFINCTFTGQKITFKNCKTIKILNCIFNNFKDITMYLTECNELIASESKFYNCENYHDGSVYGGIIQSYNLKKLYIDKCKFEHCKVRANYYSNVYGLIFYDEKVINFAQINNNVINSCQDNTSSNRLRYPLFYKIDNSTSKIENNNIVNTNLDLI